MKKLYKNEINAICEYVIRNGKESDWKMVVESLTSIRYRNGLDTSTDSTESEVNNKIEKIISNFLNSDLHDYDFNLRMIKVIHELDECNYK